MAENRNNLFDTKIRRQQGSQKIPTHYMLKNMYETLAGIIAKRISMHLEKQTYCHQNKKEVTLEIKVARIN